MKKFLTPQSLDSKTSLGLLIMRVIFGVGMALHGWGKIQNPMAWAGDKFPGFLQLLAAVSEFGGGIACALGLLTLVSAFGMTCTMVVAVYFHAVVQGDPFVSKGGPSYEMASLYLCFGLLMMLAGPGKFSVDNYIFKSKT